MKFKYIVCALLALAVAGGFLINHYFGVTPQGMALYLVGSQYTVATKYSDGGAGFVCSKPIKLQKRSGPVLHINGTSVETHYLPVDEKEANMFCHITWIE